MTIQSKPTTGDINPLTKQEQATAENLKWGLLVFLPLCAILGALFDIISK